MSTVQLNSAQHKVVQKIAAYFKYPKSKLMAGIDREALTVGVLSFPGMDEVIGLDESYYPIAGGLNFSQLLDSKKFKKSELYEAWLDHYSNPAYSTDTTLAYCTAGVVFVIDTVVSFGFLSNAAMITLDYDYLENGGLIVTTLQNSLLSWYPSPPCD